MRFVTFGIGVAFILLAAGLTYDIGQENVGMAAEAASPLRMTYIFLGLLGFFGVALAWTGLSEARTAKEQQSGNHKKQLITFMVLCVAYGLCLQYIGLYFMVSTAFLLASMLLLGTSLIKGISISVAAMFCIFLIFRAFLDVPLP